MKRPAPQSLFPLLALAAALLAAARLPAAPAVRAPRAGWARTPEDLGESGAPATTRVLDPAAAARAARAARLRGTVSSDNFIEVFSDESAGSAADGVGFKGPVFQSAVDLVQRLGAATGLKMPRGGAGLVIYVGAGTNEDARVVVKVERSLSGARVTRVYLPSPGFSDLDVFCREIASAWLRAWAARTAAAGVEPPDVPPGVACGLVRAVNEQLALFDRLRVLELWQDGSLPYFPSLVGAMDPKEDPGPAVCGFLVKWALERKSHEARPAFGDAADLRARAKDKGKDKGREKGGSGAEAEAAETPFARMMARIAEGGAWDDRAFARLLTGEDDPHAQDRACGAYLDKLRRGVLVPGLATPEDVTAFAQRLVLNTPAYDVTFRDGSRACDLRLALRMREDPAVRVAAFVKSRDLELTVIGRGDALVKAAASYVRFLRELAKGGTKEKLDEMLDEADALLGAAYRAAEETFGS